jgi:hypothetical protein
MNKHFEDTRHHLKRATEAATHGVKEELEPIEQRVRELTGREKEPEPGRFEQVRDELKAVQAKAEGEAKEAIGEARAKLRDYRESRTA